MPPTLHYCTAKSSSAGQRGLKVELGSEPGMGLEAELVWGWRGNEGKAGLVEMELRLGSDLVWGKRRNEGRAQLDAEQDWSSEWGWGGACLGAEVGWKHGAHSPCHCEGWTWPCHTPPQIQFGDH